MLHLAPKKYWLIIVLGGLLFIGSIFVFWSVRDSHATITVDILSPRAQEFITKEMSDGSSVWNTLNLASPTAQTSEPPATNTEVTTPCFELKVPSPATNPHFEATPDSCRWEGKLTRPLSYLVIGKTVSAGPFNDHTGIQFRRRNSDKYQEIPVTLPQFDHVSVFRSVDELTIFAQAGNTFFTIGFTGTTNLETIDQPHVIAILESLTWPASH